MERILLLEDDKSLVTGLTLALGRAGYALDTARTLAEAGHLWQAGRYDLLMLDVTLPDGTGFDFWPGGAPHFRGAHPVSDCVG